MRALALATSALLLALSGCVTSPPETVDPGDDDVLAAPSPDEGFQWTFGKAIPSGTEVHICKEFVVPGDGEVSITGFESQISSDGTHHLLAYRTPKTAADVADEVFDCGDVPGPIVFTQSADAIGGVWPQGVGLRFQPGEVVRLELHYLNTTSEESSADVRFNAWFSKGPLTAEAGSFFMYDRDIAVPAHGKFTARMHCEIPQDIQILNILPHVHVRGVAERIYLSGGDLAEPRLLVDSKGYGDLEARSFLKDPIVVQKGQSLDFECDYENTTGTDVIEGPSKEHNEMCMILGDYYPRMETAGEWCTLVGSGAVHDGARSCKEAYAALTTGQNADFASEQVIVDVCAPSNDVWNNLGNCAFNNCSSVCPGPDCQACASKHCTQEFFACQSATCE